MRHRPRRPADLPFGDFARLALARRPIRASTLRSYVWLLDHHCAALRAVPAGRVTRACVQDALADARRAGLSAKSVQNLLRCLRSLLREAGSDAADGLRVKAPDPEVRPLDRDEAQRLLDAMGQGLLDQALRVLLATGLRLGELRALRSDDWQPGRRVLLVRRGDAGATKSGRAREVDVPEAAVPALERLLDGHPPHPRALRRRLARLCATAALPHVRVHDLRHTRFTLLLLTGAPPLYVSQQAGHHSPAYTLRVYGHLSAATPEQRRAWANAA